MVDFNFTNDLTRDFTKGRIFNGPKGDFNDPNRSFKKVFLFGLLKTPFWMIKNSFSDDWYK
jgi:hypothetical protein